MTWFLGLDSIVRRIMVGVLLFCLLAIAVVTLSYCSEKRRADEADAVSTMANGRTAASGDASKVRDRSDLRTALIDDTVKGATDEVRNAADPASGRRAARDGVCRIDPSACPR